MQIVLFRHGIAVPRSPGLRDAKRALTDEGIKKTRKAAEGLQTLIAQPNVLLTSPLLRARQTADLLGKRFDLDPIESPLLAEGRPTSVVKALGEHETGVLIAVGHEPDLSGAAELLCFRTMKWQIQLKKAGAVCMQTVSRQSDADASAELLWLATPKMLRELAG